MKHVIFAFLLLIPFQLTIGQGERDSFIVSPRLSFADYSDKNSWDGHSINKIPPTALQVEKFLNKQFSYGGFIGYYRDKFTNDTMRTNFQREINFAFGGVATFHYSEWLEKVTNNRLRFNDFDLYLSGMIGWKVSNLTIKNQLNPDNGNLDNYTNTSVKLILGPSAGVRYYISDYFAMSLEIGSGNLGMVTMGVNWIVTRKKRFKEVLNPTEKTLYLD